MPDATDASAAYKNRGGLMKTRIISGVLGSVLVAATLILGQYFSLVYNILVAVVAAVCVREIFKAGALLKNFWLLIPSMLFSVLWPLLLKTDYLMLLLFVYFFAMFVIMVTHSEKISFDKMAFATLSPLVITLGMGSAVLLCYRDLNHALYYVMLSIAVPWVADSGAYFVGSFFGKHKLCPNISPKKTIEGAVGGIAAGVLGAVIFALIFDLFVFSNRESTKYLPLVIMAALGGVVSIFGDLSFSIIKRSCHIKDYGTAIPGHGGILDRCDSLIFTIPFIFIFTEYFPILSL